VRLIGDLLADAVGDLIVDFGGIFKVVLDFGGLFLFGV
jgi:hypothetical protein